MGNQTLLMMPGRSLEAETALQFPPIQGLTREAMDCFQRGMNKLHSAEPEQAVDLLLRTAELAPAFPEVRICLGLAYALSHNIYPAIDHLEMAGQLDPQNFAAHFTLAKLNFKLRIPQKGYAAAQRAMACMTTIEQRKMLTELLKEERARERNGIARPWFNKPFGKPTLFALSGGFAAALIALFTHVRW